MTKDKSYLLFVDTNIYLDFYRTKEHVALVFLRHLEGIKDKIISSYQVEMEYKKHRQEVVIDALDKITPPSKVSMPPFISERKGVDSINNDVDKICKKLELIKKHMNKVLLDPIHYDEVYRICQRIFRIDTQFNLTREKKDRFATRRLAGKRFYLGYPPRKDKDTSIGDAINWEWIIQCCAEAKKSVIIVSRDGDYGPTVDKKTYINDWLKQEFKDRVGHQDIVLTRSLSDGLKKMNIKVTSDEIEEDSRVQRISGGDENFNTKAFQEAIRRVRLEGNDMSWLSKIVFANSKSILEQKSENTETQKDV